jgi:hypothetical protein
MPSRSIHPPPTLSNGLPQIVLQNRKTSTSPPALCRRSSSSSRSPATLPIPNVERQGRTGLNRELIAMFVKRRQKEQWADVLMSISKTALRQSANLQTRGFGKYSGYRLTVNPRKTILRPETDVRRPTEENQNQSNHTNPSKTHTTEAKNNEKMKK